MPPFPQERFVKGDFHGNWEFSTFWIVTDNLYLETSKRE